MEQRRDDVILTVTLNPSVDVNYQHDSFTIDTVNRVEDVSKTAGGKGLNVARVLRQLNRDTAASGYLGGSLGDLFAQKLRQWGFKIGLCPLRERHAIALPSFMTANKRNFSK